MALKFRSCTKIPWAGYDETEKVGLFFVHDLMTFTNLGSTGLYLALYCGKARKATDIRDRIYGMLGIMEVSFSAVEVDYQIKPIDLWRKMFACVCHHQSEDFTRKDVPKIAFGEVLAEALELDISSETIKEFVETHEVTVN